MSPSVCSPWGHLKARGPVRPHQLHRPKDGPVSRLYYAAQLFSTWIIIKNVWAPKQHDRMISLNKVCQVYIQWWSWYLNLNWNKKKYSLNYPTLHRLTMHQSLLKLFRASTFFDKHYTNALLSTKTFSTNHKTILKWPAWFILKYNLTSPGSPEGWHRGKADWSFPVWKGPRRPPAFISACDVWGPDSLWTPR